VEIQRKQKVKDTMKTIVSWIAPLLFVVLGSTHVLFGAAQPVFTVTASPVAVQLPAGGTATTEISVLSGDGYSGTVELACGNLPPKLSCTFMPSTLQLEAGAEVSSQLTIAAGKPQFVRASALGVLFLAMMPILGAMFSWRGPGAISKAALLLLFGSLMLFSGCQGLSSAPAGNQTYPIAVTATAPDGTSNSVQINVTVQQ
jgi:hypothetical protein